MDERERENVGLPLLVWKAIIGGILTLLLFCFAAIAYYHHRSVQDFISTVVQGFVVLLAVVFVGLALFFGYKSYHTVMMQKHVRKAAKAKTEKLELQNAVLREKARAAEQLTAVMQQAINQGLNIKYEGLEVTSYLSNIHTLSNGSVPQKVVDALPLGQIAAPLRRLTVDEICAHIERNSYQVYIGSSLTKNLTPLLISIKGRHLKVIGATQKGKSSFVGSLIDIVSQTHDPAYVQFALLDKEHQTSRLFADLPHLLRVVVDGKPTPVHAKNTNEVVEYLSYLLQILDARNAMSRTALAQEPVIVVYIEEFLRLKKELKAACATTQDREGAVRRYTQFSFAIGQLAGLGLKLRMYLWLVAQMDYADKDPELQEAMVNITSGLSFCVRQTAALAAGFYQTELLSRNAQENKAGQAVCEMPDCNDLILAPDFDLEQRLQAREQAEIQTEAEEEQANTVESDIHYTGPYLLRSETPAQPAVGTPLVLPAIRQREIRRATLSDAIDVWNDLGEMGRPRLREELIARGLECSDDLAKTLIKSVKRRAGGGGESA
jgi:DNA translocase FtsK/SpoIIIE-like protein